MTKVLSAAGLPNDVLELIPDIVDTCRECRKWQRPQNDTVASVKMSTFQRARGNGLDVLQELRGMSLYRPSI